MDAACDRIEIERSTAPPCGHAPPAVYDPRMAISPDDARRIGQLARLGLDEAAVERLAGQLSDILGHFAALAAVDTESVEPTAHPLPLRNVMRADEVAPSLTREEALANAPEVEDGLIRVRAVLE